MEGSWSNPSAMQIIPAIDLLGGSCVRLHQGDYDQVTRFSDDPVAQALSWQNQGAQRLHLVDLDGARSGEPANDAAIRAITEALTIPVQLGGGVRSAERAEDLLQCGLERVILGTVALEKPELVVELAGRHPGRVIVGIDARYGKVATRGWIEQRTTPLPWLHVSANRRLPPSSARTSARMEHWLAPTWTRCGTWPRPARFR